MRTDANEPLEPDALYAELLARLDGALADAASLESLSRRQSVAVRQGDAPALLDILAEREGVIARRAGEQGRLLALLAQWDACGDAPGPERLRLVRARREGAAAALERVREADASDARALGDARDRIAAEAAMAGHAHAATAAYAPKRDALPAFQDRRG